MLAMFHTSCHSFYYEVKLSNLRAQIDVADLHGILHAKLHVSIACQVLASPCRNICVAPVACKACTSAILHVRLICKSATCILQSNSTLQCFLRSNRIIQLRKVCGDSRMPHICLFDKAPEIIFVTENRDMSC